jgi:hypothetical protein
VTAAPSSIATPPYLDGFGFGITAIVTDSIVNEGFEALTQVLGGRPVNFVVLQPESPVAREKPRRGLPARARAAPGSARAPGAVASSAVIAPAGSAD